MNKQYETDWFIVTCDGFINQQDSYSGPMATGTAYWARNLPAKPYLLDEGTAREYFEDPRIGYEGEQRRKQQRVLYRIVLEEVDRTSKDPEEERNARREELSKVLTKEELARLGY